MGQAKLRGTPEERKAQAIAKKEAAARQARATVELERAIGRHERRHKVRIPMRTAIIAAALHKNLAYGTMLSVDGKKGLRIVKV